MCINKCLLTEVTSERVSLCNVASNAAWFLINLWNICADKIVGSWHRQVKANAVWKWNIIQMKHRKWGRIKLRLSFIRTVFYSYINRMNTQSMRVNPTRLVLRVFFFYLERCSLSLPFAGCVVKRARDSRAGPSGEWILCARTRLVRGAGPAVSRGGVELWTRSRVSPRRARASHTEGRHSARALLTSLWEFPRLRDIYVQSMAIYNLIVPQRNSNVASFLKL